MSTKRFRVQRFIRGRRNETPAVSMANRDSIAKESEKVDKRNNEINKKLYKNKNVTSNHAHKAFQTSAVYSRASEYDARHGNGKHSIVKQSEKDSKTKT